MVIKITLFIQLLVGEGTDEIKICIELFYGSEAEIGSVDKVFPLVATNRKPFVDGTREFTFNHFRAIHLPDGMGIVHVGIPTGDRAVFGREHEKAGARLAVITNDKVIRIRTANVIEDIAGWGCERSGGTTFSRRDSDHLWHSLAVTLIPHG